MNIDGYAVLFNKNDLIVKCKDSGSKLDKKNFILQGTYKIPKKSFMDGITKEYLIDIMYNPEKRIKWDDSLKQLKILEGNKEVYVVNSWMKSPMMFVAERDIIDKRIEVNKNGIYYNFSSSVNDDVKNNLFLVYS